MFIALTNQSKVCDILKNTKTIQKLSFPGILHLLQNISVGAAHDSLERHPPAKCFPGTQTAALESISTWIEASGQESSILWVHGPEKSAIAQTVAESCMDNEDKKLAASFFFSRKHGRDSAEQLWATIAFQMAMSIPGLRASVQGAVRQRPDVFSKAGVVQMRQLIVEPFLDAGMKEMHSESRFLVIIDSLEECKRGEQCDILNSIAGIVNTHYLPLLFLITSRPELESRIRDSFGNYPVQHLNLSDSRGVLANFSDSALLALEEVEETYVKSLVFDNNGHVPPGAFVFDTSGVLLTDSLDLSHVTELSLWDMDIKSFPAMQEAVRAASGSIQTFIWRFNLDAPPSTCYYCVCTVVAGSFTV